MKRTIYTTALLAIAATALASDVQWTPEGQADFHPWNKPGIDHSQWTEVKRGKLHISPFIAWLNPSSPTVTLYLIFEEENIRPTPDGNVIQTLRYFFQFEGKSIPFNDTPSSMSCQLFQKGDRTLTFGNSFLVKHVDLLPYVPTATPTPIPTVTPTPTPEPSPTVTATPEVPEIQPGDMVRAVYGMALYADSARTTGTGFVEIGDTGLVVDGPIYGSLQRVLHEIDWSTAGRGWSETTLYNGRRNVEFVQFLITVGY